MSVIKRTKYFIKPGFQSRLTAIMILLVIIVANLVGGLTYCFAYEKLTDMFTEYKVPIGVEQLTKLLLPGVLFSELISIFLVGFLCIKITHTIAGPVYRMERVARGIGEGDLTNFIKLRQRDELKDLADSMNEMTLGLRNKVISLKEDFSEIRENLDATKESKDVAILESTFEKLNNIEETLQSFVLEKEHRTRLEDEENESSDDSNDDSEEDNKTSYENESKSEYETKPTE